VTTPQDAEQVTANQIAMVLADKTDMPSGVRADLLLGHSNVQWVVDLCNAAITTERERLCAAIKAADDKASEGDYMLTSDDSIRVIRGTWAFEA
jgi:hypothetical protein